MPRGEGRSRQPSFGMWSVGGILLLGSACGSAVVDPSGARPVSVADRPLGNSVGAIGSPGRRTRGFGSGGASGRVAGTRPGDPTDTCYSGPPIGGTPGIASATPETIVTWLILPVVICLSQGLSHACPSISNLYRETANGSLNQLSFI
jgi:hypothetical protein